MIGIVNYNVGNIRSIQNAVRWVEGKSAIVEQPDQLEDISGVLLPGVGAYIPAMNALLSSGMADALRKWALVRQRPLLGVCLGMQLLATYGTEGGESKGLGLLPAKVVRIRPSEGLRVPHVGWNRVAKVRDSLLWDGLDQATCYFVHSYQLETTDWPDGTSAVTGVTDHGGEITAMVEHGNIMGTQFHPEKSQKDGLAILANFVHICEQW